LAGVIFAGILAVSDMLEMLGRVHAPRSATGDVAPIAHHERPRAAEPLVEKAPVPAEAPEAEFAAAAIAETTEPAIDAGHDAIAEAGAPTVRSLGVGSVLDAAADARPPLLPCRPDLARAVDDVYSPIASYRASFDQVLTVSALGTTTESHGVLVTARPGMMSWAYDDPEDSRILSDGQTVTVYEAPNKHLFRVPAASSPYPGAFAFLTGQGPLRALFDFIAQGGDSVGRGSCLLIGTPRALTRAYSRVLYLVDRRTAEVRRVVIVDRAGDQNKIDLRDPVTNADVSADQFTFAPPIDTIVVGR
jgi:outer membrane lipoprotein carrier protein